MQVFFVACTSLFPYLYYMRICTPCQQLFANIFKYLRIITSRIITSRILPRALLPRALLPRALLPRALLPRAMYARF